MTDSAHAFVPPEPVATPTGARRAAVMFVFITVMLDMLALGLVLPVLPRLILGFLGNDTVKGAEIYGLFGTTWALMQFLVSPAMGALSDRVGRRPVILISNFGLGLDYVVMAMAPNLTWLWVGRLISGVTAASISTSFAYIADVTTPEKRAGAFGMVGAAFGVGFVLGPAVGGLLGGMDPRLPFWVAAGLSLLNGCWGLFVLPESLPPARRSPFLWRRANPIGALSLLRARPQLLGLAMVNFLSQLAHVVLPSTFVIYGTYRYHWGAKELGLTLAGVGICSMIVQAGLVRPIVKRIGERRAMAVGLVFGVAGIAIFGLAPSGPLSWIGIPVFALWGLANPSAQSLMSRLVAPTEQGRMQGANSSLAGIANLIGPGMFTAVFSIFIAMPTQIPGAPFLLASALIAVAAVLGWRVTRPRAQET